MKTILHWLLVASQAALLVLSVIAVFRPEFRGMPMRLVISTLFIGCCIPVFRGFRGVMHKTPREVAVMNRGKSTVLEGLALLVGAVAFTLML